MLKFLEIQGFKSFADKTTLDFPVGITAVVGPNGSGKSNIVDAIRWVLGDQGSKTIRVSSNADVIFSGTPQQPASSVANVALVFDNRNKVFPLDYEEVMISRKIYRDGNSEYFVNKKQARLKDVVQLLAGAKLGVRGMSIINQGASDVFLKANPRERREMLEEMVGLKEYRLKKEEAERKVKETKENLLRVQTLILEMEPNLHSLKRQVSRWKSRAEKENELRELELRYFAFKFSELRNLVAEGEARLEVTDLKKLEREIASLKATIVQQQNQIAELDKEDPQLVTLRQKLNTQLTELNAEQAKAWQALGRLEGQLELLDSQKFSAPKIEFAELKKSITEVLALLEQGETQQVLVEARAYIAKAVAALKALLVNPAAQEQHSDKERLLVEQQSLTQRLAAIKEELGGVEQQLTALQQQTSDRSEDLKKLYRQLEQSRQELSAKESGHEELKFLQEKKNLREDDLRLKMQESGWDYETFEETYKQQLLGFVPLAADELNALEIKLIRLRRDLGAIGELDAEVVKEYDEINARYEFLVQQKQDLESALADWEKLNLELEGKITTGFQQALAKIDKEFNRFFEMIFDGGRASLKVEKLNSESPIEAAEPVELGIEFSVSLPRKKVKSLEMLSGGEKTLTAVALLFAIIAYAQPPFLVLDEMDAALDENNSRKVAKLLKDLGSRVQFVLITHNRSVMEAADILYGVTMDDGISKIFSLRFAEAEELAEQDVHEPAQSK